jgi:glucosylceramidase
MEKDMRLGSKKLPSATRLTIVLTAVMLLGASLLAAPVAAAGETVGVWETTADQTKLLQQQANLTFAPDSGSNPTTIDVTPATTYQQINGFGASLTDSSASLICGKLTTAQQTTLLNNLFNPNTGIGLSFLRQPMGASDFSSIGNYSYDDMPAGQTDPNLTNFNITHDLQCIIPLLKQIKTINPALSIMANPWSPPGWMKTSGSMIGGNLQTQFRTAWANYFVKFVQAYAAQGLPINYISMQNEPLYIPPGYPGMGMSSSEQATLLGSYLGPAFAQAGITSKILVWDHNWTNQFPYDVLGNATANSYAAGTAFHWYGGTVDSQTALHNSYPNKGIWFTEGSGFSGTSFAQYLKDIDQLLIIGNMRNWGQSTVRWNLALDQNLGPQNGGCNNCTSTVTINNSTGAITYNPEYYALAQGSKFVVPGAYRIDSTNFTGNIENVAFKNPDGSLVVIAFNAGTASNTFKIRTGGQSISATLPAGAVATYKWMPGGGTPTPTPTTAPPTPTPTPAPTGSGTNIAQGKPVTCSSIQSTAYPCAAAVDGSLTTRWSSAASDPQWINIDLGQSYNINHVTLNWEAAYGKSFQIQTSADNTNWTSIYSTTTGTGGTQSLAVSGTGRYIRMYGTVRGTGYGYSLWEFAVNGTPVSGPTPTPVPTATATAGSVLLSQGHPVTCSSIENTGTPCASAVDGNTGTRWSSAFSDPQWIYVDLGATHSINKVVLNWEAAYGKAFQIQTSNDAATWTSIYSTTTGTGGVQTLNITGSGRYVRMYGTVRATGYGYSLWEFQVSGS